MRRTVRMPVRASVWPRRDFPAGRPIETMAVLDSPVVRRVVWYRTPVGVLETEEQAVAACVRSDLLPELCIEPVVAAIAVDGRSYAFEGEDV